MLAPPVLLRARVRLAVDQRRWLPLRPPQPQRTPRRPLRRGRAAAAGGGPGRVPRRRGAAADHRMAPTLAALERLRGPAAVRHPVPRPALTPLPPRPAAGAGPSAPAGGGCGGVVAIREGRAWRCRRRFWRRARRDRRGRRRGPRRSSARRCSRCRGSARPCPALRSAPAPWSGAARASALAHRATRRGPPLRSTEWLQRRAQRHGAASRAVPGHPQHASWPARRAALWRGAVLTR